MAYPSSVVTRSAVMAVVAAVACALVFGCQLIAGIGDIELATPDGSPIDAGKPNPCDAGLAFCADACVSVATDTKNCGVCGHDCLEGACYVGVCQPTMIASNSTSGLISDVAVDTTDVYWTVSDWTGPDGGGGEGGVYKCGKVGCVQPTLLATKQDDAYYVAVDSTNVYWTLEYTGFVKSCAIGGCGGTPKVLASGMNYPVDIATDGVNVYWANIGAGTIVRCPISGCGTAPTVIASNQWPWYLALDATNVYWATGDGSVRKCGKTATCGFQPVVIASNLINVTGIAADAKNVYWTADLGDGGINGNLSACATGGCTLPTTLVSGLEPAWDVAADGLNVYWTSPFGGASAIWSCGVTGCNGVPTRVFNSGGVAITVDDVAVYWSDFSQVYRVAK